MAWIRLSDDYVDHPKFSNLCDGAFRLWHQGLAFCRKYQTDGLMPMATIRQFKAYSPKRMKELMQPWRPGMTPLWEEVPGFGMKVHDYLEWNLSKEEAEKEKASSKQSMRDMRERRKNPRPELPVVKANNGLTLPQKTRLVTGTEKDPDLDLGSGKEEELSGDAALDERAGRLREVLYPRWYGECRQGAKLRIPLIANTLEYQDALSLVSTWDDARLEKLARIILTTDEPFIASSDRSFKIFAMKATWADDRLRTWETQHGVAV